MFCWLTSQEETRTLKQPAHAPLTSQHFYQHNTSASVTHITKIVFLRGLCLLLTAIQMILYWIIDLFVRLVFTRLFDSWSWWDVLENCWCTTALVCLCWGQQRNCCGSLTLPSQPSPGSRHGLHTPGATNLYIAKYQSDWWKQESNWAITCIFRNVCSNLLTNKSHNSSIEPLLLHIQKIYSSKP